MGKNPINLILSILLIILSFLYLIFVLWQNKKLYSEKFNPRIYEKKYYSSQWVVPNSKNIISDEDLFTYVGYRYIKGMNPILINPETAHLGKYLIGISIVLFNNQRVMSVIVAFLSLLVISHLVYFSTRSYIALSIALFLTIINTLFIDQLVHAPQLDIYQLLFFLLFTIFFLLYRKAGNKLYLLASGLSMGYFNSTKFFLASFITLNLVLFLYYIISKLDIKKVLIEFSILNIVAFLTYMFTYTGYFLYGGTFRGFLGVQKYIYVFYKSSQIDISKMLGNYLGLIFLNRWRFWTSGYPITHYQSWSILWPIIFILGILSVYKLLKDKATRKKNLVLWLVCFLIAYNIFLFITPIFPRYLLLLFVPLNILVAMYFGRFFDKLIK